MNSKGYMNISKCPLALAAQEYFKNKDITAAGYYIDKYNSDFYYDFDVNLFNTNQFRVYINNEEKYDDFEFEKNYPNEKVMKKELAN